MALKPEAQAFVDKYKLKKTKLNNFTLFSNEKMKVIISGVGVKNAKAATKMLLEHFKNTDNDIYLNVGICGASNSYEIGELLEIGSVLYDNTSYRFHNDKKEILCLDEEASESLYDIVDMESYGFYDVMIHSNPMKNFHIFKVVSDHFQPHKVTKEKTKSLIFNKIDDINATIFN